MPSVDATRNSVGSTVDNESPYPIAMLPGYSPGMVTIMVAGAADLIETLMADYINDDDSDSIRSIISSLREMGNDVV